MANANAKFKLIDDNWAPEFLAMAERGIVLPVKGHEYTLRQFVRSFQEDTTKIHLEELRNPEIPFEGCMYLHEPSWPLSQFRPLNSLAEKLVAFSKYRTCYWTAGDMHSIESFDPEVHKNNDNYFKPGFLLIQEERIRQNWQDETGVADNIDPDIDDRIQYLVKFGARVAAGIDQLQRLKLQQQKKGFS